MKTRKEPLGLGIESSCDETSVALLEGKNNLLAHPVYSQIELHEDYFGVVPEVASRAHLEKMPLLLDEVFEKAKRDPKELDYIGVTVKPGLVGSLLVGYHTALALATELNIPCIPVHHLEAHLYAVDLMGHQLEWPFLGLLLSGGNTAIYKVKGLGDIEIIGETKDDAAGEALDKAAKLLNLRYPGGPEIEKAAIRYIESTSKEDRENPLPVTLRDQPRHYQEFSFSGLKTALRLATEQEQSYSTDHLAYSFQERIFEAVERNLINCLQKYQYQTVVAAGGVLANKTLQHRLQDIAREFKAELLVPSKTLCTDNGAMIAATAYRYFQAEIYPDQRFVSSQNDFRFTREREPRL